MCLSVVLYVLLVCDNYIHETLNILYIDKSEKYIYFTLKKKHINFVVISLNDWAVKGNCHVNLVN